MKPPNHKTSNSTHTDNKLQTFAARYSWNTAWLASDIKNNWPLNPWNKKMCTLANGELLYTSKSIKDYSPVPTIDCRQ